MDDKNSRHSRSASQPSGVAPTIDLGGRKPGVTAIIEGLPAELRDHPRYRVVRLLGKGGMGAVYEAEHLLMERPVAIKIVHGKLVRDATSVERFRNEVKAAARLSHPNIVAAHDAEQAGHIHFLVMEYIDGVNLARLVDKKGPLSIALACRFIQQAALGLQHAFEHGMVHRDIKPHNLMLTRQGQIKILDFGLARLAENGSPRLTQVGSVIGTPDYIAPEQITDSHHADIRADIYSLGCTLYFLLTGKAPFAHGSLTQKVQAHVGQEPLPVGQVRPEVPEGLRKIVARMMAKDPEERYQTPREVAHALSPFCTASPAVEQLFEPELAAKPSSRSAELPATKKMGSNSLLEDEDETRQKKKPSRPGILVGVGLVLLALAVTIVWSLPRSSSNNQGDKSALKPNLPEPVVRAPRILMVLPHKNFWYPDYGPVRGVLEQGGASIKVASSDKNPATPKDPKAFPQVQPDLLLKDAKAADFDALYFAGGMQVEYRAGEAEAATAQRVINDMLAAKKVVSGLCVGVWVLADAGVLKGKAASPPPQMGGFSKANFANIEWRYTEPVVVSDNIVTGGNFNDGERLATTLLQVLDKRRRGK